jgi:hypothetical protein
VHILCEETTACSTENDRAVNNEEEGKHKARQKERLQGKILLFHVRCTDGTKMSYRVKQTVVVFNDAVTC